MRLSHAILKLSARLLQRLRRHVVPRAPPPARPETHFDLGSPVRKRFAEKK